MLEEAGEFKVHIDAFISKLRASENSEQVRKQFSGLVIRTG